METRKTKWIIIFLGYFLFLSPCLSQYVIPCNNIFSINLGDSYDQVVEKFGESDFCFEINETQIRFEGGDSSGVYFTTKKTDDSDSTIMLYCKKDLGFQILIEDKRVTSILFLSDRFETSKGIRVGDSKEKLIDIYGIDFKIFNHFEGKKQGKANGFYYEESGLSFYFDRAYNKIIKISIE